MAITTPIPWCDSVVNPVMGCNPTCELMDGRQACYAYKCHLFRKNNPGWASDFFQPTLYRGRMETAAGWRDLTGTKHTAIKKICPKPWLDGQPRMIFVSDAGESLSDRNCIYENGEPTPDGTVPFAFLKEEVIDAVTSAKGQRHVWLWLTKRPERMAEFSAWLKKTHKLRWPRNLWAGTTITTKKVLYRAETLARVGQEDTTRFLSVEPLWEAISLKDHLAHAAWVIVGGESKQCKGPSNLFECDWARRLRDECAAAGVAFFMKQVGANCRDQGRAMSLEKGDTHGEDMALFPRDLRIREVPHLLGDRS